MRWLAFIVLSCFHLMAMIVIAGCCNFSARAEEAASRPLPLGFIDAKPAQGRFMDLGDGTWMVPYRATIADGLSFQMVPLQVESPRLVLMMRQDGTMMKDHQQGSQSCRTESG